MMFWNNRPKKDIHERIHVYSSLLNAPMFFGRLKQRYSKEDPIFMKNSSKAHDESLLIQLIPSGSIDNDRFRIFLLFPNNLDIFLWSKLKLQWMTHIRTPTFDHKKVHPLHPRDWFRWQRCLKLMHETQQILKTSERSQPQHLGFWSMHRWFGPTFCH